MRNCEKNLKKNLKVMRSKNFFQTFDISRKSKIYNFHVYKKKLNIFKVDMLIRRKRDGGKIEKYYVYEIKAFIFLQP